MREKKFWVNICLFNLCIVALLGLGLRTKILFTIPFVDYRNLLSAHSHFAFAGWAGLALITLMVHEFLPIQLARKKIYACLLIGIQVSAIGMAIAFPFYGYNPISIFFSTLYIAVTLIFFVVYLRDIINIKKPRIVKLFSLAGLSCLLLSYLGTLGLIYILSGNSTNSLLYRDSVYVFLHFQYNGFFTLVLFALFFDHLMKKGIVPGKNEWAFAVCLCLSVIPSLFLSLLWHNSTLFYVLAAAGSLTILLSVWFFYKIVIRLKLSELYETKFAGILVTFAAISFVMKMVLNAGTIIPALGDAVYGDRPVIIGFLHLVFLGLLSFYLLAIFTNQAMFTMKGRLLKQPLILFAVGIFLNEILLFVQGLIILLNFNSAIFKWLLWGAAIVLFMGSIMMFIARLRVSAQKRDTI